MPETNIIESELLILQTWFDFQLSNHQIDSGLSNRTQMRFGGQTAKNGEI